MKKVCALLCLFLCFSITAAEKKDITKNDTINVYSLIDSDTEIFINNYNDQNPGEKIKFIPLNWLDLQDKYEALLEKISTDSEQTLDIIIMGHDFFEVCANNPEEYFLDLTDIYESIKDQIVEYPSKMTLIDGKIYGIGLFPYTGAYYYRRSLAKKYLGTDDPVVVQKAISDWDKFSKTAEKLYKKSNGKCKIIAATDSLHVPFLAQRKQNWVEDGKLVIDPLMLKYLDICKEFSDKGYEAKNLMWGAEWLSSMNVNYEKEKSYNPEIFGYFFVDWQYFNVFKDVALDTKGDWGIVKGPASYFWSSTIILVNKKCRNPELAKKFIKFMLTDEKSIMEYSDIDKCLYANKVIMKKKYSNYKDDYLNGQNVYLELLKYSEDVVPKAIQSTDSYMQVDWMLMIEYYLDGRYTKDGAIKFFKDNVENDTGISD